MSINPRESATSHPGHDPGGLYDSLRVLFGSGTLVGLSDGQLLERFLRSRGDLAEAAFRALVERHGSMVLGVCRSVLGDRHDAEDAFQACFLVLAQRANSIRKRDAVASWLYGVAHRVSLRARRRSAKERQRATLRIESVSSKLTVESAPEPWPELYEELDRLPERFRAAVVLCDLEGRSYEQAAALLDCPIGTVQSRLARGRQRLRTQLTRRGLVPLIALVGASSVAGQAQARLSAELMAKTCLTTRAAAQTVATLATTEERRLVMKGLARIAVMAIGVGVVLTEAIGLSRLGRGSDDPPQAASSPTPEAPKKVTAIHIRVVEKDGTPAPGVEVQASEGEGSERTITTDGQGRAMIQSDTPIRWLTLIARRGKTLGWATYDAELPPHSGVKGTGSEADPLVMTLLPLTHRIEGTVTDTNGQPVADARVVVTFLKHERNGMIAYSARRTGQEYPTGETRTDRDGRFAIMLPEGTTVWLAALHSHQLLTMKTVAPDAATLPPIVMEPGGDVVGLVRDAATGKPVPGASVAVQILESHHQLQSNSNGYGFTVSDTQGRFRIEGLEPGVYNVALWRVPDRDRATARAVEGVRVRVNEDTRADLDVIEGRALTGVVVDAKTERPVSAGLEIGCYGPAHPQSGAAVQSTRTDNQGRFTFFVPPGSQYVYVMSSMPWPGNRLGHQTVIVPEQGEPEPVRLAQAPANAPSGGPYLTKKAVEPARATEKGQSQTKAAAPEQPKPAQIERRTLTGRVVGPDGKSLAAVRIQVSAGTQAIGEPIEPFDMVATDQEGVFELERLPRRALTIYLSRPGSRDQMEKVGPDQDRVDWTYRMEPDPKVTDTPRKAQDEPIPPELKDRLTFVNLDVRGNDLLVDSPGRGNDLARLPGGIHKLGTTFFRVGRMMVHVKGQHRDDLPATIADIAVGARADRVHFLHAVQQGVDAGTEVAAYVVHYTDGSSERIPIRFGKETGNWWRFPPGSSFPDLTDASIAWTGSNDTTELNPGIGLQLYAMAWTNPHPEKPIASLDVESSNTMCDPFLVAVTVERAQ